VKSCAFAVALIGSIVDARAIECQPDKGDGYPWAWRQIDGKRCWYKGKPGMDKTQLRWADSATAPARTNDRTVREPAEHERLLHSYWPPLPPGGVFGDRFEAARGKRP
jgi:hypothetical protein